MSFIPHFKWIDLIEKQKVISIWRNSLLRIYVVFLPIVRAPYWNHFLKLLLDSLSDQDLLSWVVLKVELRNLLSL